MLLYFVFIEMASVTLLSVPEFITEKKMPQLKFAFVNSQYYFFLNQMCVT